MTGKKKFTSIRCVYKFKLVPLTFDCDLGNTFFPTFDLWIVDLCLLLLACLLVDDFAFLPGPAKELANPHVMPKSAESKCAIN
jgi:hypothetical protein